MKNTLVAVVGSILFIQVGVNAQVLTSKRNPVAFAVTASENEPAQIPKPTSFPSTEEIVRVAILAVFGVTVIKAMKS